MRGSFRYNLTCCCLFVAISFVMNSFAEQYTIVQLTNVDGSESIHVYNSEQYEALSKRIRIESSLTVQAHLAAEKKWKEDGNEGRYGGRVLKVRRIIRLGASNEQGKAREQMEKIKKNTQLAKSNVPKIPPKPKIRSNKPPPTRRGKKGRTVNPGITEAQWKKIVKDAEEEIELYHKTLGYYAYAMNQLVEERDPGLGFPIEPVRK